MTARLPAQLCQPAQARDPGPVEREQTEGERERERASERTSERERGPLFGEGVAQGGVSLTVRGGLRQKVGGA